MIYDVILLCFKILKNCLLFNWYPSSQLFALPKKSSLCCETTIFDKKIYHSECDELVINREPVDGVLLGRASETIADLHRSFKANKRLDLHLLNRI